MANSEVNGRFSLQRLQHDRYATWQPEECTAERIGEVDARKAGALPLRDVGLVVDWHEGEPLLACTGMSVDELPPDVRPPRSLMDLAMTVGAEEGHPVQGEVAFGMVADADAVVFSDAADVAAIRERQNPAIEEPPHHLPVPDPLLMREAVVVRHPVPHPCPQAWSPGIWT